MFNQDNIKNFKKRSNSSGISTVSSNIHNQRDKPNYTGNLYLRKAISLDKNISLFQKKNKQPNRGFSSTNSVNKQIQCKKLASLQQNFSISKLDNISHQYYSTYFPNKDYNSFSFTTVDNKRESNSRNKEGIIRGLKANYSQDKLRFKKDLSVNTDFNSSQSFYVLNNSTYNNHNININNPRKEKLNDSTFLINNILNNVTKNTSSSNNTTQKKEQPLKLYTESTFANNNSIQVTKHYNNSNLNTNLFTNSLVSNTNKNSFNSSISQKMSKRINDIEAKMEKSFKENTTNSKSRKYNIIKHSFEELLKVLPNSNISTLLQKMFFSYHEVFNAFSTENREIKEMNLRLTNQTEKIKKTYNESLIMKENEIEFLKKRINELTLSSEVISTGIPMSSGEVDSNKNLVYLNSNNPIISTPSNEKFIRINKNNLDDLDALYFFDKVDMKKRSASLSHVHIPTLYFRQNEKKHNQLPLNNNNNIPNNLINNIQVLQSKLGNFNILKNNV